MIEELARTWKDAADLLKSKAELSSDGVAEIIIRLVDLNLDTVGVSITHNIYEGVVSYHSDENLSDDELAKLVRERFNKDRNFVREFTVDRGSEHHIVHSIDEPHVEGVIVW